MGLTSPGVPLRTRGFGGGAIDLDLEWQAPHSLLTWSSLLGASLNDYDFSSVQEGASH